MPVSAFKAASPSPSAYPRYPKSQRSCHLFPYISNKSYLGLSRPPTGELGAAPEPCWRPGCLRLEEGRDPAPPIKLCTQIPPALTSLPGYTGLLRVVTDFGVKYIKVHSILLSVTGTTTYFYKEEEVSRELLLKSGLSASVTLSPSLTMQNTPKTT